MVKLRWFVSYQEHDKNGSNGYPWRVVREWPEGVFVTLWWFKKQQEAADRVSLLMRSGTHGNNDTASRHEEVRS
jgi:hypothetical protein